MPVLDHIRNGETVNGEITRLRMGSKMNVSEGVMGGGQVGVSVHIYLPIAHVHVRVCPHLFECREEKTDCKTTNLTGDGC